MEKQPWLIRMENGTIGEARTKAFLLDRFWILERSVDIDGADFIIQRRLTERNLLDKTPPRFGVIQVKFMQDKNTTQYIHEKYILENGKPRKEFFLIVHTGIEEDKRKFLLSAADITENFKVANGNNKNKYAILGSKLLTSKLFEIQNEKYALNRIEKALELADFGSNRRFLTWALPSYEISMNKIDYKYTLPLDNGVISDIPKDVYKLKRKVQSCMFDMEDVLKQLSEILQGDNPLVFLDKLIEINEEYGINEKFNETEIYYLYEAIEIHDRKYKSLKEKGLLDNYLKMQNEFEDFIIGILESLEEWSSIKEAISINIFYNSMDLSDIKFVRVTKQLTIDSKYGQSRFGVIEDKPEQLTLYFYPKLLSYFMENNENERIRDVAVLIRDELMGNIYDYLFSEEVDIDN
ncbi:hypothetical protein BK720_01650 [Bacillus thuringiensis serovar brasilensis]|uniref:hypothetical protein n=1 Tax=Bacillus cereus group TaxID=86661 RepID=UPI000A3BA278|nr:hypothetical protein [Bacillus thuringiensis]MCU5031538.1 hypothetical protein [Bacillus cereus]MRA75117.1 hypothetical protein [Bacillus thuringiensis]MRA92353.1 hypothetical protein [Bacillus thuringiensis]MRC54641.1 hypothetical protein [Bacillus thuringiensis]OTX39037.1 hypothetical protein BK720_01650 [Bacillus thuringiensis serovar brasilensis]